MFDLISDAWTDGKMLLGLPGSCDLSPDPLQNRRLLRRGQSFPVQAIDERPSDTLVFDQQRSPNGLGRMSGEDRGKLHLSQQIHHLLEGGSLVSQ